MKFCKWKLNQFKQRTDLKFITTDEIVESNHDDNDVKQ